MGDFLIRVLSWINDRSLGSNSRHSPDEVERRLQAGQWINLPLHVTQPAIPVLLFLLPFADVAFIIAVLLMVNVLWMRLLSQRFVLLALQRTASTVASTRWLSSLVFAALLLQQAHLLTAAVALLWPIIIALPLFALHRFWPADALANTQRMFRAAAKNAANVR